MPRFDGTGPEGMGPMTGRGAGPCAGYDVAGSVGRGRRRGWRHWYHATGLPRWARSGGWRPGATPVTKEEETEALQAQAKWLGEQLEAIQSRISELTK
jgi:hypothetical protein